MLESKKIDKGILEKFKRLSDSEFWKIIRVFEECGDCYRDDPEKCEYQAIRDKLGLEDCDVLESKKYLEERKKALGKGTRFYDNVLNVRKLSDEDVKELIAVFDGCTECWDDAPEDCEHRPLRERIGVGDCYVLEIKKNLRKMREAEKKKKD